MLFSSRNGIEATLSQAVALAGSQKEAAALLSASGAKMYALGADAAVVHQWGLACEMPAEASTQGLARHLAETGEAQGSRALCPVPLVCGGLEEPDVVPKFMRALSERGVDAERVNAYLTRPGLSHEQCSHERELFLSGLVDSVIFSSTAEAQGLARCLGVDVIERAVQGGSTVLAAHGPYTAKGVERTLG